MRDLPEKFPFAGIVVRNPEKQKLFVQKWGLPVYGSLEELLDKGKPDFAVTSLPWEANLPTMAALVRHKVAVLSETPIAPQLPDLLQVYEWVKNGARIQVAEQYIFQPTHAAALAVIRSGRLGTIREADISVAHGYHGTSLLRNYLQVGLQLPVITGRQFMSKIVNGPGREGPPTEDKIQDSGRYIVQLDYGDRLGIYDFTGDLYFSWIRSMRRMVRGERGEINQDEVRYLKDFQTPVKETFTRRDTGHAGNLEGYHHASISLAGEAVYTNPFPGARWSDDEIAVATSLAKMQEFVRTGKDFYSVAEASHDRYLDILMEEAVTTGKPVQAVAQPWC